jgi:hypothetical protein
MIVSSVDLTKEPEEEEEVEVSQDNPLDIDTIERVFLEGLNDFLETQKTGFYAFPPYTHDFITNLFLCLEDIGEEIEDKYLPDGGRAFGISKTITIFKDGQLYNPERITEDYTIEDTAFGKRTFQKAIALKSVDLLTGKEILNPDYFFLMLNITETVFDSSTITLNSYFDLMVQVYPDVIKKVKLSGKKHSSSFQMNPKLEGGILSNA